MAVTVESINNFNIALNDTFLVGVYDTRTQAIHLALADGAAADCPRSTIGGLLQEVLPRRGGHSTLGRWAGIAGVRQVGVGIAEGPARGFVIQKTGAGTYRVDNWTSGLNPLANRQIEPDLTAPIITMLNAALTGAGV